MTWLTDLLISCVLKLSFLNGYRSYIGGGGFMLLGLSMLLNEAATGVYDHATTEKAIALMAAGFGVIGHAGKQDKLLAAVATSARVETTATPANIVRANVAVHQAGDVAETGGAR